ncbi:hypothetical protein IT403_03440 [Candidatus Nomurabacteria bacterium]|nr:hypothetical protein [Candidatus Nomurabacteria bacterium]
MAYAKRVKNLSSYGTIYDRDGYMLFEENLKNLFSDLFKRKKKIDFSKKYKILISIIVPNNDYPYRSEKEKIVTFRSLLNYWKNTFGKAFVLEDLKEKTTEESFVEIREIGCAWNLYGAFLHFQKQKSS